MAPLPALSEPAAGEPAAGEAAAGEAAAGEPATDQPAPSATRGSAPGAARVEGIDVARGIASILMIQGHAFDAFASPAARASALYALEASFLQTLALPSFLLLAGASLALRIEAAARRGESATAVRAAIVRRGLGVVLAGYALNAFSAVVDGFEGPETWLRADVLHVIGLSLVLLGGLGTGGAGPPSRQRLGRVAWLAAVAPIALCAPLSRLGAGIPAPFSWAAGLVLDVPPVTRMPLVPLLSWVAIGALVCQAMIARNQAGSAAGAPDRVLLGIGAIGLAAALALWPLTGVAVGALGGELRRTHPAVVLNALDLAGRGAAVLAFGALLAPRLPPQLRALLLRLGRGSLVAYVVHLPLCYGRLGGPWAGRLGLAEAALAAALLVALGWLAVLGRDALRARPNRA